MKGEFLVTNLIDELKKGESELVEVKKDNSDLEMIVETISAISNSACINEAARGYMIWGLEDATFNVVGTSFFPGKKKFHNQEVNSWLSTHLTPRIYFRFTEHTVEDKHVVVLDVPSAKEEPTKAIKPSKPPRAFVRDGSSNVPLEDRKEHEKKLWNKLQNIHYEDTIVASELSGPEVLALLNIGQYCRLSNLEIGKDARDILSHLEKHKLIKKSGMNYEVPLSTAYLLASNLSEFPQLESKYVRIISYDGNNNLSPAISDEEIHEGVAEAFQLVYQKVLSLIPRNERIDQESGRRLVEYAIPTLAIREALINAFVHQDFSVNGSRIFIEIFKNRIDISNPGRPLLEPLRFLDERPVSRNEKLVREMRNLGLAEDRGSGWDKIVNAIELHALPAPEIKVRQNSITVSLWYDKPLKLLSLEERNWTVYLHTVLKYLLNEPANNASLRQRLNLPESKSSTVSKLFRQATEGGLVKPFDKESSNKTKRYVPIWSQEN